MLRLSESLLKVLLLGLCCSYSNFLAQNIYQNINPLHKKNIVQKLLKSENHSSQINYLTKRIGHYSLKDWAGAIDSTWGEGLPTEQKLEIFDKAYNYIDQGYGAFVNLDINLDSLYNLYRPEIAGGVSKGRFAAIMNYISMALMDGHTYITDMSLYNGIEQRPGLPLFLISTARNNAPFGACLTPLPDSTLLVYRALQNHQLGLEPGDIVLGYDGIFWKNLYKEIIKAQLPIALFYVFGSTNESMTHYLLQSAGLNWHLFDTIDIVKYSTGDTLHLSTAPMMEQSGNIWGNEQLQIPGVEQPDFYNEDYITWGIVEGTDIGYIYIAGWNWEPQYHISEQFYNAVDSLMNENETRGMIIDMRCNYGGSMIEADEGYSLLFNQRISKIGFDLRGDPNNHFDMVQHPEWPNSAFDIQGDRFTYYDKPIAVLTGPGAVSNGDWESLRLGYHPMSRVFGKPTCGAYTLNDWPDLGNDSWYFTRATGSGYILPNHEYMAHRSATIDEEVWLKQEDVANGDDTVVKTAMEWINGLSSSKNSSDNLPNRIVLEQNYPNPFNPNTTIKYSIPSSSVISNGEGNLKDSSPSGIRNDNMNVSIKVYDILGRDVTTLVNEVKRPGNYEVTFDASTLTSGMYFYELRSVTFRVVKKMLLLK